MLVANSSESQSPQEEDRDISTDPIAAEKEAQLEDEEIKVLVQRMRTFSGLEIRDRWFNFRLYRLCFTGTDAVNWLTKETKLTKEAAIELGNILVERKIIHHVEDKIDFKDGNCFYRFYEDDIFAKSISI